MSIERDERKSRQHAGVRTGLGTRTDSVSTFVRLHSDENPYGCSLNVQEALGSSDLYNLPVDPVSTDLRAALSDYTGFSTERIVAGAGASELIERLLHAFLEPGDGLITCPPSLPQHNAGASRARVALVQVPRTRSFDIDPDEILSTMHRHNNIKMVALSSPNNPTGNVASQSAIVQLLHTGVWVLVDETYFEFCDRTVAPLVGEFDNLVVLRSFSPWAGLHGLPVGYALCSNRAVARLQRLTPPGGLNWAAQIAAIASLNDRDNLMQRVRRIRLERGRLYRQLRKLNLIQPYPSATNFLLCQVTRGEATMVQRSLQDDGILVKPVADRWLTNHLRISVGRPEDTNTLVASLKRLAQQPYL